MEHVRKKRKERGRGWREVMTGKEEQGGGNEGW